jgi:hypothetical protein
VEGPLTLKSDSQKNYIQFFEDSISMGFIWGLQSEEGWAQCESNKFKDAIVMPFWSQAEYAKNHCSGEWSNYEAIAIDLEEFLDDWLTGMHEDVILVGVNWDENLEGEDYEPLDILYEYEKALNN